MPGIQFLIPKQEANVVREDDTRVEVGDVELIELIDESRLYFGNYTYTETNQSQC